MTRATAAHTPGVPNLCPPPNPSDVVRISAPEWRLFLGLVALGTALLGTIACAVWRMGDHGSDAKRLAAQKENR